MHSFKGHLSRTYHENDRRDIMTLLQDYIVALTNLYGVVHKRKVVEIYNQQNNKKMDVETIDTIMNESAEELRIQFVYIEEDYFVHEAVMIFDELDAELEKRQGKPYYVPAKSELMNYLDEPYFEKTKQYKELLRYMTKYICNGDKEKAVGICRDITGMIHAESSLQIIMAELDSLGVEIADEDQLNNVIQLIINHSNHARIWSNNGYTPNELAAYQPHYLQSSQHNFPVDQGNQPAFSLVRNERQERVGRNESCPCGSGKKYKKCCMDKRE